jgi:succinate dehydrogenase flavin-adding protein (antitoxin of CptAB toxin-antitoxin module)
VAKEDKKVEAAEKPSYEQLEQQVQQLLKLVNGYKQKADQLEQQLMLSVPNEQN